MTTRFPDHDVAAAPPARWPAGVSSEGEVRRFRDYTYWSLVAVTAFVLGMFLLTGSIPPPPDPLGTVGVVAVVAVVLAIGRLAAPLLPREPGQPPLTPTVRRAWATVGMAAAGATAVVWTLAGEGWLWALAPAAIVSLLVADLPLPRRRVAVAVAVAVAAVVGLLVGVVRDDEPIAVFVVPGLLITGFWLFMTLASLWTWRVVVQLDEARRSAAELAVANERLRFAADLHDIQGHSLQVIALKSELASRLADTDPAAAAGEMEAVQRLAADALHDTRSVVEGYRRTSLDAEIANATTVLASAGIDARLHVDEGLDVAGLPPPVRHLLGLVVREAVTNVLRHSTATRSDLLLTGGDRGGGIGLVVTNDGVDADPSRDGGGLVQLAARLRDAGGELRWRRDGDAFEVRASVPRRSDAGLPNPEGAA